MKRRLVLAILGGACLPVASLADPLALVAGKPVTLACETQSVVVAPEAATTKGTVRLRLEAKEGAIDLDGVWSVIDVADDHKGSFAAHHKDTCAAGCPLGRGKGGRFELWAPRRAAPGQLPAGAALTVATIDAESLAFRASTFLGRDIAALEKGACKAVE